MEKRSLKILVVDDNLFNQILLLKILNDYGHVVETASNGYEAVEASKNKTWDIILMDLMMPIMNGFDATMEIRSTLGLKTPIVAVTSNVLNNEEERCHSLGMNGFLSKPVENTKLENAFAQVGLKL